MVLSIPQAQVANVLYRRITQSLGPTHKPQSTASTDRRPIPITNAKGETSTKLPDYIQRNVRAACHRLTWPLLKLHERRAYEHTRRNEMNSWLHRIPPELILIIAAYLEPADLLCFAFSSQRLWDTVRASRRLKVNTTRHERGDICKRLRTDSYTGAADKLRCSYCSVKHEKSAFSRNQMLTPSSSRFCFGAEGNFRWFGQWGFTFDGLTNIFLQKGTRTIRWPRHTISPESRHFYTLVNPVSSAVTFVGVFRLFQVDAGQPVTCEPMEKYLAWTNEFFCPHLLDRDAEVLRRLLQQARSHPCHGSHSSPGTYYPPHCGCRLVAKCWSPNCDTTFSTTRSHDDETVRLEIRRCIRTFNDVIDPKWRAQLTPP